ncbi:MAG: ABC transporter substrate-binding protein, partial [Brachybacterium tyrofermentans]
MFDAAFTPKRRTVLLSLAGIPVLLSACAKTTDDGGGSGGGGDAEGALTVGTTDKVTALDPAAAYDNGSSTVWTQVYGYLMNTKIGSEDGKP